MQSDSWCFSQHLMNTIFIKASYQQQLWLLNDSHSLYAPISSYPPCLSNNSQPHSNLLKTTKATICKATNCISRGMVWLWIRLLRWVLQPSLLFGSNVSFSKQFSVNHHINLSTFRISLYSCRRWCRWESKPRRKCPHWTSVLYNLWYLMICNMSRLKCLI